MIYLNLGRREVGKTTLAYFIVSKLSRRVIFDPRGLFPADRRISDEQELALQWAQLTAGECAEIVVTPDNDVQTLFDATCDRVRHYLRGGHADIGFVVDELRFIPDLDTPSLNWILRCATRDSVAVVFTAHRPKDVHVDIRAISDVWCVFHTTQANDLEVIEERCSPGVADKASRLPPRHFIAWNDAKGQMTMHTHPERWRMALRPVSAHVGRDPVGDLNGDSVAIADRLDFTK